MEHSPARGGLGRWRREIRTWRREMARKLRRQAGLKGKLKEMLANAWEDGREEGIEKLVEHANPSNRAAEKALRRSWEERLPEECLYALEDIAGYDPEARRYSRRDRKAQPDGDVSLARCRAAQPEQRSGSIQWHGAPSPSGHASSSQQPHSRQNRTGAGCRQTGDSAAKLRMKEPGTACAMCQCRAYGGFLFGLSRSG